MPVSPPYLAAGIRVETNDERARARLKLGKDALANRDESRIPFAEFPRPKYRRTRRRPGLDDALLARNRVVVRPAQVRPIAGRLRARIRNADESGPDCNENDIRYQTHVSM